ncbi:MAG: hypothetical protein AAFP86_19955 [Planctomycetota bacterium]
MFPRLALALLALVPASCSSLNTSEGPTGVDRLSLIAGARAFDDDALWDPVDGQAAAGLEFSSVDAEGLGFEVGVLGSIGLDDGEGENTEVTGASAEAFLGVRGAGTFGPFELVIGVGASALAVGIDNDTFPRAADDEDFTTGFYGHVGLLHDLGGAAFVGVDVRALGGTEVDLGPRTGDADYVQAALVLGVRL